MSWWRTIVGRLRPSATPADEQATSISTVKHELESRLLAMPGVVSVGVGRTEDGTEVIVVGVDGSRPDVEPRLPTEARGFPVEIRRVGPLRAT